MSDRAPANDDPAHPAPITREQQIALMEGAAERHAIAEAKATRSPGFREAVRRARAAQAKESKA